MELHLHALDRRGSEYPSQAAASSHLAYDPQLLAEPASIHVRERQAVHKHLAGNIQASNKADVARYMLMIQALGCGRYSTHFSRIKKENGCQF